MITFWDTESRSELRVPSWVSDLESFRRWSDDDDFPEHGRISYLGGGEVYVDMSKEQLFTHGYLKTIIAAALVRLVQSDRLGRYWCDGAFITNIEADVSNEPDGVFVSAESRRSGRVRPVEGRTAGYV